MNAQGKTLLIGLGAVAVAAIVIKKLGLSGVAAGAVNAVGDAASGVVLGIGDVLGVPRVDASKCAAAKRDGRTMDALTYCPAGDSIVYAVQAPIRAIYSEPRPPLTVVGARTTEEGYTTGGFVYDEMGNVVGGY